MTHVFGELHSNFYANFDWNYNPFHFYCQIGKFIATIFFGYKLTVYIFKTLHLKFYTFACCTDSGHNTVPWESFHPPWFCAHFVTVK